MPNTTAQEAVVARLVANGPVNALVAGRVHPNLLAQGEPLPAITYTKIAGTPELAMGNVAFMDSPMLQVTSWSASYAEAIRLAQLVRSALRGYVDPATTPAILAVIVSNETERYEPDTRLHGVATDFVVWVSES